jgi:glycosyltransferase involved in cell wall biosynthesis
MYSGNHSLVHPLDTVLEAARQLRDDPRFVFAFIGGGLGKQAIEAYIEAEKPTNVVSLPYQPLARIKYSLSAADVHVVAMGEAMVGLIHPCKVYGALSLGRPILYLGPARSHVADLMADTQVGWHVEHGDVPTLLATLETMARQSATQRADMGKRAAELAAQEYNQPQLAGQLTSLLTAAS